MIWVKYNKYDNTPRPFELGEFYLVSCFEKTVYCKLIKVTEKGYNFLDVETSKCIFKYHFYASKKDNHSSGLFFFVNYRIIFKKQINGNNIQSA